MLWLAKCCCEFCGPPDVTVVSFFLNELFFHFPGDIVDDFVQTDDKLHQHRYHSILQRNGHQTSGLHLVGPSFGPQTYLWVMQSQLSNKESDGVQHEMTRLKITWSESVVIIRDRLVWIVREGQSKKRTQHLWDIPEKPYGQSCHRWTIDDESKCETFVHYITSYWKKRASTETMTKWIH